jgi:hypothetical protein
MNVFSSAFISTSLHSTEHVCMAVRDSVFYFKVFILLRNKL